jgi:hypothetical protein
MKARLWKSGASLLVWIALLASGARAELVLSPSAVEVTVAGARRLEAKADAGVEVRWESSAPDVAEVFSNGWVAGLKPGRARVTARSGAESAECVVTVKAATIELVAPESLRQFPDNREFRVGNRKCFGSELNGERAVSAEEKRFTRSNRVINPQPLRAEKPLEWELRPGTEVRDGAGVLLGVVPPTVTVGGRTVPVSMFNFGAGKILRGRIFIYAFSVTVALTPEVAATLQPGAARNGRVSVSAWVPLDGVTQKELLLERLGLGQAPLPALPLATRGRRVTGGDPKMYMTTNGELMIVRRWKEKAPPPVPSHYLRRPGGTINLVYSVPGFGLGGEGLDSFLISDGLEFFPAPGAKLFHQPTYAPPKSARAGQVSGRTMTFLYGALKTREGELVYGWMAEEALAAN